MLRTHMFVFVAKSNCFRGHALETFFRDSPCARQVLLFILVVDLGQSILPLLQVRCQLHFQLVYTLIHLRLDTPVKQQNAKRRHLLIQIVHD